MISCVLLAPLASLAARPLPIAFEAHAGSEDPRVRFSARRGGISLALLDDGGAVISHPGRDGAPRGVRLRLDGALACPEGRGEGGRGEANHYIGKDRSRWRTGIPTWDRVRYASVWPGIDLVYYAREGVFEHDFVVAPGADPGAIALRFEGLGSAAAPVDLALDRDGGLRLAGGDLTLQAPRIYQEAGGVRRPVAGRYVPAGPGRVRIAVDAYDPEAPLVIDPVIVFSSFLGGSGLEFAEEVATDSAGNLYLAGRTLSSDFPLVNPAVASFNAGYDIFVAKVSADGQHLLYSTYLGSQGNDQPTGIAVDAAGDAFVANWALADDFPVVNALQPNLSGLTDLTVTKLDPAGAIAYSTYLGGSGFEVASSWPWGSNIKARPDGTAYVTGGTFSTDFPLVNSLQPGLAPNPGCFFLGEEEYPTPCSDLFLTVLSPAGDQILYSTLWGGPSDDAAGALDIDASGAAYLLGNTESPGFPLVNPFQSQIRGGGEMFVMKIRPDGTPPVYATFLGGSGDEGAWDIRVDAEGSAYVLAETTSTDLPAPHAVQPGNGGGLDWFLAKINPRGTGVDYATYFGGPAFDVPQSLGVDALGNVAMTGYSLYGPFPTFRPMSPGDHDDGFVVKLHATGPTLLYSTPIGGAHGLGIDVDFRGDANVVGGTDGTLSAVHPFQGFAGVEDAYLMKIADGFATLATPSRVPAQPGGTVTVPIRFTPGGLDVVASTFSLDYDETCLSFDPTDADADGIPDAVTFSLPPGYGKSVRVDPLDTQGEIDLSVFDPAPPFAKLPLGEIARITFQVKPACGATTVSTLARVGFSSTPAASFGDATGHSASGISLDGSVEVWGGAHGDCNADGALDAGDLSASALEVFDGDGSFWLDAPLGAFDGSPAGCDANGDQAIDAGDLSCTVLLIFQGAGACSPAPRTAAQTPPTLRIPAAVSTSADGTVQVPVQLQRGTESINTLAFSLIVPDGLTFDPTDADGDGIPDAVAFSLPSGFLGAAQWHPANRAGQLELLVLDTTGRRKPLPSVSNVAVITLRKKPVKGLDTVLRFGTAPGASFGTTVGGSAPGTVVDGTPDKRLL